MVLSRITALERKLQNVAPKMYSSFALMCLVFSSVLLSTSGTFITDSGMIQSKAILVIFIFAVSGLALFGLYLGRIWLILLYRGMVAPFRAPATRGQQALTYLCISIILFELYLQVLSSGFVYNTLPGILDSAPIKAWLSISPWVHYLIAYLAFLAWNTIGGQILRRQVVEADKALELTRVEESTEQIVTQGSKEFGFASRDVEPSVVEAGLNVLLRPKESKMSGTDTKGDMVLRTVALLLAEIFYAIISYNNWKTLQFVQQTAEKKDKSRLRGQLVILIVCQILSFGVMVFMAIHFAKGYRKWKAERAAMTLAN